MCWHFFQHSTNIDEDADIHGKTEKWRIEMESLEVDCFFPFKWISWRVQYFSIKFTQKWKAKKMKSSEQQASLTIFQLLLHILSLLIGCLRCICLSHWNYHCVSCTTHPFYTIQLFILDVFPNDLFKSWLKGIGRRHTLGAVANGRCDALTMKDFLRRNEHTAAITRRSRALTQFHKHIHPECVQLQVNRIQGLEKLIAMCACFRLNVEGIVVGPLRFRW